MESETIETFLESLGMESSLDVFKKEKIDFHLLMTLTENELREVLMQLKLTPGGIYKIIRRIQQKQPARECYLGINSNFLEEHNLESFFFKF